MLQNKNNPPLDTSCYGCPPAQVHWSHPRREEIVSPEAEFQQVGAIIRLTHGGQRGKGVRRGEKRWWWRWRWWGGGGEVTVGTRSKTVTSFARVLENVNRQLNAG